MKLTNFFIFLFLTNFSFGQFQATGKIKDITKNGFHEILVPPAVRSFSKQDLSDIRIFNSKGNEIPYFIQNSSEASLNSFEEYTILSKTVIAKKSTSVVIAIPPDHNSNRLSLVIANSDVEKNYSISGSNDQKEWFGVANSKVLYDLNSTTETSVIKTISYPLSTYKYLKIDFDDRKTLPVNILKAGNFSTQVQKNRWLSVTPRQSSITELHSDKETQIHVVFNGSQIINQISFEISKPNYYSRKATIYKKLKQKVKRKFVVYDQELISFELNSNTKNSFIIPELFEKDFFIKIENNDNQPLSISTIQYNQKPIFIIADLNANEIYTIKTGDKNLTEPQYDLSGFKSNIKGNLQQTSVYDIRQTATIKNKSAAKSIWQQPWFMWACILLGAVTILFFTASLIKDLKRKE